MSFMCSRRREEADFLERSKLSTRYLGSYE
jgi:hypothetical protein